METGYKVGDAMTHLPLIASPDTSIIDCSKIMDRNHVGALVVMEGDTLLGIVTEQDIVRKAVAQKIDINTGVAEIMETNLTTISSSDDVYEALMKMRELNIRHLPVVEKGAMVGLLTLKDVLKIQPQLFELLVDKFELREEERKPIPSEGICQQCGEYSKKLYSIKDAQVCRNCK